MNYYLSSTLALVGMVGQLFILFLILLKVGDRLGGTPKPQGESCQEHGHH